MRSCVLAHPAAEDIRAFLSFSENRFRADDFFVASILSLSRVERVSALEFKARHPSYNGGKRKRGTKVFSFHHKTGSAYGNRTAAIYTT